ncbi:GNAT family N-acetyltransferase [Williamsia sp.]|uniref:GNAT family N-acetyltransferase n=1 Tax=Williamsia sp. TaxID=1872085 RepID=UPI001A281A3E|nr:GNAT family N-acetyltransferase [Williamsia sp.]MBJ7291807.1 GNAT family N-acetyltransferase [Williamsia sp.]
MRDGRHPLDNPVRESLEGHHRHLVRRHGTAITYESEVSTFAAVEADGSTDDGRWEDMATLLGPGGLADMFSSTARPPTEWEPVFTLPGLQFVHSGVAPMATVAPTGTERVTLSAIDVPDMLGLVAATRPGPFFSRTHEMGTYLGLRRDGELVAMAGERLHPPGWTEISAVCTAPDARGQGFAAHLINTLVGRIVARGERPFLHALEENRSALELYRRLGFETRASVVFQGFRVPPVV